MNLLIYNFIYSIKKLMFELLDINKKDYKLVNNKQFFLKVNEPKC